MEDRTPNHRILYYNDAATPLGRMLLSGYIYNGRGVEPVHPLRVYGNYAVMCVLRGHGSYRDIRGLSSPLRPGDCVLVFPELAHWYGARTLWDEFHVTFDGPIFDLWRTSGLLDPTRCLLRPGVPLMEDWIARVGALLQRDQGHLPGSTAPPVDRARHVAEFTALLQELLAAPAMIADTAWQQNQTATPSNPAWLTHARSLLDIDLGRDLSLGDVAAAVNLAPDTLRKRFQIATGLSPTAYRTLRRIEAAQAILRYRPAATNRELAQTLGFADEFHFSRRFTQQVRLTPRQFRQGLAAGVEGSTGFGSVPPLADGDSGG